MPTLAHSSNAFLTSIAPLKSPLHSGPNAVVHSGRTASSESHITKNDLPKRSFPTGRHFSPIASDVAFGSQKIIWPSPFVFRHPSSELMPGPPYPPSRTYMQGIGHIGKIRTTRCISRNMLEMQKSPKVEMRRSAPASATRWFDLVKYCPPNIPGPAAKPLASFGALIRGRGSRDLRREIQELGRWVSLKGSENLRWTTNRRRLTLLMHPGSYRAVFGLKETLEFAKEIVQVSPRKLAMESV